MDRKKFCTCRLAPDQETGRVRWCVGHEAQWHTKLKKLVFIPIVLLPLVIAIVFLTRYSSTISYHNNTIQNELIEGETERIKREIDLKFLFHNNNSNNNSYDNHPNDCSTGCEENETFYIDNVEVNATDPNPIVANPIFWQTKMNYSEVRELQAKIMRKYMNVSVDPCDDFYHYACGNWKKYHKIPSDRTSYDTFEILRENLDVILKGLLSEPTEEDESLLMNESYRQNNTIKASDKAKLFYRSCMNQEKLFQRGVRPLRKLLNELGGWPIIEDYWEHSEFELESVLGQLKLYNNDLLIAEWIGPDIVNSKNYIIQIDQTTLGLPTRAYFLDPAYEKYLKAYKNFIYEVVALMTNTRSPQNVHEIDDMIAFETEIAKILVPSERRRNVTDLYLKTSIYDLENYFPHFNWTKYFSIILGREIDSHEPIACYCFDYLTKLFTILLETPQRTIANYLMWRFARHRTNNLDARFLRVKQKFYKELFGREQEPPRWQFCVSQVNSNMGMALGSLFVKKYFDETSKNDTVEMTRQLQESFNVILMKNIWLGELTKEFARMKIDKMNLKIGYPNFLLDDEELMKRYHDVQSHPDYFLENTLSILKHLTRLEQKKIGTQVNKTAWGTAPAVVNAYYSRNKNQITGILQPPFYHKYFPKSLNFGGIGVVIGHEITHGFDDKGRLFDQHGNLQQWWKEESIHNFHKRAKCMIDQYNSYVIPDVDTKMDGVITQGENIADNGGLKQSFKAYQLWLESNPDADETLPGLNLTGEQLFFLNFAQVWCGKQRLDALKSRLRVAVHSPGIFRVIGTLSNSEDFSRVYNCPLESAMNPKKKCILW